MVLLCPTCRAELGLNKLAELEGSEKQINWAADIRAEAVTKLVATIAKFAERKSIPFLTAANADIRKVIGMMATETSAQWWIENRNAPDQAMAKRAMSK